MTWTTGKNGLLRRRESCRGADVLPRRGPGSDRWRRGRLFGQRLASRLAGRVGPPDPDSLQRPTEFAGRATLTEEEAAKIEEDAARDLHKEITLADAVANRKLEREGVMPSTSGSTSAAASRAIGGYNKVWFDSATSVTKTRQTSLLIDPPDGRMPPLTPAGQKKRVELLAAMEIPAGPEDRSLPERCIKGSGQGRL